MSIKCANCLDPYMDLSKHPTYGLKYLIKRSKFLNLKINLVFINVLG